MFLDIFMALISLDLGWLFLAIVKNIWWFFAFFAALHFFQPGKSFFPGFFFMVAFSLSFGAFFKLAGWAFPSFIFLIVGWIAASILVKGTRLEKHEISLICVGVILGAVLLA